jgi:hypothetical protein
MAWGHGPRGGETDGFVKLAVQWWGSLLSLFFFHMQMGGWTPTGPRGIGSVVKETGQLDRDACIMTFPKNVLLFLFYRKDQTSLVTVLLHIKIILHARECPWPLLGQSTST